MSRTKKGSKSPGFDYWTARPTKGTKPQGCCSGYGPEVKRLTHRSERRIGRAIVAKEVES
jgi:hypothetical protein